MNNNSQNLSSNGNKNNQNSYSRINGIQHVGVGVPNFEESLKWYRKYLGMDITFFNGAAQAPLMQIYTKDEIINKNASMILNLHGGCAMEVVSPISFKATHAKDAFELGDLGIYITQVKSPDVQAAYNWFKKEGVNVISDIENLPWGGESFYIKDPNGLIFQIVDGANWFIKPKHYTGGTVGVTIGVSNIENSMSLYSEILGYNKILSDTTGVFEDWKGSIPGGDRKFRRVLLSQSEKPGGGFARVSADTYIELVEAIDYSPKKIYHDRMWGDIGFVHLGFDVRGMNKLGEMLAKKGFGFTCNTDDVLQMGDSTRVHCTYIEDPDGTLIEMIEVYKIPIIKKLGIYLNVEKRSPDKPLPNYMLKALKYSRTRDK